MQSRIISRPSPQNPPRLRVRPAGSLSTLACWKRRRRIELGAGSKVRAAPSAGPSRRQATTTTRGRRVALWFGRRSRRGPRETQTKSAVHWFVCARRPREQHQRRPQRQRRPPGKHRAPPPSAHSSADWPPPSRLCAAASVSRRRPTANPLNSEPNTGRRWTNQDWETRARARTGDRQSRSEAGSGGRRIGLLSAAAAAAGRS